MSANPTITDIENEDSVSLHDIIAESEELEETASAVLGGSDHQACTYDKGYVGRQALYACGTCATDDDVLAGICLACSLECHDGHDLFELYTKRNFCCDCGNKKFLESKCKLVEKKDDYNEKNSYNHNFEGKYCTCNRPYPDLDDSVEDEMIQCIVCEDWYHSRHLVLSGGVPENYAEMICHGCSKNASFLKHYSMKVVVNQPESNEKIDVETNVKPEEESKQEEEKHEEHETNDEIKSEMQSGDNPLENKHEMKKMTTKEIKQEGKCKLKRLMAINDDEQNNEESFALFFNDKWREDICTCAACKEAMEKLHTEFLYDMNDMTIEYEKSSGDTEGKSYNKGMDALSKMDRVQQVEMISGYNEMKSSLTEYLKGLDGKVITENDIQTFFEQLKSRKKPRVEMSYFCK